MTSRASAPIIAAAVALMLSACAPTDGPAGFCGWMGADIEGLGQIVTEEGTMVVGTWFHVFAEGVTDADQPSRESIARTISNDREGFDRLISHAESSEVKRSLERLDELLRDPNLASLNKADPTVKQDIALLDAQGCDFLRGPS